MSSLPTLPWPQIIVTGVKYALYFFLTRLAINFHKSTVSIIRNENSSIISNRAKLQLKIIGENLNESVNISAKISCVSQ